MKDPESDIMAQYLSKITTYLALIQKEEKYSVSAVAKVIADHVSKDKILYVYGPGGHSNLGAQEVFFRAGGLMHVSAILDEGTLLSSGALRSMAIERTPGYGAIVIDDYDLQGGDLLLIVNAYGINSACIDAALEAKRRGVHVIAITSVNHAKATPPGHPARHPSKKNLYELADMVIDSKMEVGDAVIEIPGLEARVGAISTFTNAYILNSVMAEAVRILVGRSIEPPIWTSANAPGGDEANSRFVRQFRGRVRKL